MGQCNGKVKDLTAFEVSAGGCSDPARKKWLPGPFAGCLQLSARAGELAGADHPNGAVLVVDGDEGVRKAYLNSFATKVRSQRGVLWCKDAAAAIQVLQQATDHSMVCFVCARSPADDVSKFLRRSEQKPCLRSLPLVMIAQAEDLIAESARVGTTVETQVEHLAERVLSLPSRQTICSEAGAGLFKGLLTDIRFGHFLREGSEKDWVFSDNRTYMLQSMHASRMEWYPRVERYDEHVVEVASYVQGLQPVHRCKPGVFLAMLREGGMMSRSELESLLHVPDGRTSAAVRRAARHVRLQELTLNPAFLPHKRAVFKFAEAMCQLQELQRARFRKGDKVTHSGRRAVVSYGPDSDDEFKVKYDDDGSVSKFLKPGELQRIVDPAAVKSAKRIVKERRPPLSGDAAAILEAVVSEVVEDAIASANGSLTGIGYGKDKELGTNRHVFATLGPNRQFEYGSVVILLNRALLYHPDTWVSPLSATGFMGPYFWSFRHRPWTGAALAELAADCDPRGYAKVADTPENDEKGVVACIHSSVNMAAMQGWPYIIARDLDAMCQYLAFEHRNAYDFDDGSMNGGLDWQDGDVRRAAAEKLLDKEQRRVLPDAWRTVVEYYETKNSHTLCECHLPSYIPLGAIEKVCISDDLYQKHSEVQEKVNKFILPDGRRLEDLIVITKSRKQCMDWQHDWFDDLRMKHLLRETKGGGKSPVDNPPISFQIAGQAGQPVFLPPDFGAWFAGADDYNTWKAARSSSLNVSFCCRATHDIRVFFSSTAECQRQDADIRATRWRSTTYHFCLGTKLNSESYITKGVLGTRHKVHHTGDPLIRCVAADREGEPSLGVWERYWFRARVKDGQAMLTCGRGPLGSNVMMEYVDKEPITDLKYIGLTCWNEPTVFCDVRSTAM